MPRLAIAFWLTFALIAVVGRALGGDAVLENPRCEFLADPPGIDVGRPRLSWYVTSPDRGWKQAAYQVLAASDPERLARDEGDLWDSGRVPERDSTAVVYEGKPLAPHQVCYWKARVWDMAGQVSAWSKPARFSRGPADWSAAAWIGRDAARAVTLPDADLAGAKWIWHADDKGPNKPRGRRLFVASFRPPGDSKIDRAELVAAGDDFFRFTINGKLVASSLPGTGGWDRPVVAPVTVQVIPGVVNTVRVEVENGAEGPAGLIAKLRVVTDDGRETVLVTDGSWKSVNEPGRNWHNRPLRTNNWPAVSIEADYGGGPWGKLKMASLILPPPVYLRTGFQVAKPLARATLYSTSLGIHDVEVNGKPVAQDYFSPGWTDYTKRVYYRAHDVTSLVRQGENALGAILADGWYSGYVGFGKKRDHYGKKPRFRAILHLDYTDGTSSEVATGPGWKAGLGPIREADFLMGERYDARIEADPGSKGWAEPGFDQSKWAAVDTGAEFSPAVQWGPEPPVTAFAEVKPRSITSPSAGTYVFDMGRNFAGVVRLKIHGKAGQPITIRHAERLNPNGTIYTTNLREARATDVYIPRGDGEEIWSPRFTYHGFQYVEISGLSEPPALAAVTGLALSSATPRVGEFACSDPMLNALYGNIYWTQRANFIDIPTDCPQRDERLGWTGDAQVYIATAALNCDVHAFFIKWLQDLVDGQRADGQFPMVAPVKVAGDDGGPAWADAGVICPWTIYQVYDDRRLLERQYPSMVKFVEFCKKRSTPELLPPEHYHCFGDWLSIEADTPKDVLYTAYFAYSTSLLAQAARALGHEGDAERFEDLFAAIKTAFNRAYVDSEGRVKGNTQTSYVLAIAFDLVDGEKRELAGRHLVADVESRGHLSTGFIGTKSLMQALSKIGR